jgi:hypothetical protein
MADEQPTQGDRDAAAGITGAVELRDFIRAGRFDGHDYVQAFARHADAREAEVVAGVCDYLIQQVGTATEAAIVADGNSAKKRDNAAAAIALKIVLEAIERGQWKGQSA